METTRSYNDIDATADYERTTLAATFADKDGAHAAIHRLHDEGFGETWLGITKSDDATYDSVSDETRVEADNWFSRFFGEGDESLHDALVRHGVAHSDALLAGGLAPHSAVITVDGANHPELAAQVISDCGGTLITKGFGSTGYGTSGTYASASPAYGSAYDVAAESQPMAGASLGSVDAATDDRYAAEAPVTASDAATAYGAFRAGRTLDDDARLQLREERLRIDKERRSIGEATVGKTVVSQTQEIDVPLIREELFIERRPVNGGAVTGTGSAIGADTEVIRIPLTEERLDVSKVAVVTEEVVIGKRQVEEIGHVSETTRKEQLEVKDIDAPAAVGAMPDSARF